MSLEITPATTTVSITATQQFTATATYSDGTTANVSSTATWTSSSATVATVNSSGLVTGVSAGVASVSASFNNMGGSAYVTVSTPTKTLSSIAITPAAVTVTMGMTQQLKATGSFSDGSTTDLTAQVAWSSANPSFASVSSTGVVTGVATGSSTIMATLNGVNASTQITVSQPARTLTAIAVNPISANVAVGSAQQLSAIATYSDSSTANVTTQATWVSSKPAYASVNASGLVTAVATGSATITATLSGMSGSTQITVPAPTLNTISVTPLTANVAVGSTQQFSATATYSDNSIASVTNLVTWTSSKPAFATITASGIATGVATGSASITATLSGVSGVSQITVQQVVKTINTISITPAAANVAVGSMQQLTATATYSDNSTANVTTQVTWTSSKTAFASVNSSGTVTGVAAGSASITATLNNVSGTSQISVPQATMTLTSIAVTPSSLSITVGAKQQFVATATYGDNSTANVTGSAVWASSASSSATISATGLATAVAAGSTTIAATLSNVTGISMLTVSAKTLTTIVITPNPATAALGTTQQLTATANYQDGSTANVSSTVTWTVANNAVVSVNSTGMAKPIAAGSTTIAASLNGVSGSVPFVATIAPNTGVNILTWQNDVSRSGLNATELSLTPTNVGASTFGKLFSYQLDGYEYGEPLLMSGVTINNGVYNVVFAATENDSVYAFDADSYGTGAPLWKVSLLNAGETPLTKGPIKPYVGITSTPVIDPTTNTIYVVSTQASASGTGFRLNALDITTGAQRPGSPVAIEAHISGTNQDAINGVVHLTTSCIQRGALLLENGQIYMGFSGCHSGWLLTYNAKTLAQVAYFNSSPDQNGEGPYASAGGIWMSSGGPVADASGNIYVVTGNGPWDGKTAWADSVLKFNSQLQIQDYFTPQDYAYMNCNDADLSAGGLLLIPGTTKALTGGKTGKMYLVDTTNLGKEQADDAGALQSLFFEADKAPPYTSTCSDVSGAHTTQVNSYEIFATAAYYNSSVYMGITPTGNVPSGVRQFTFSGGTLNPYAQASANIQGSSYGTTPFISASSETSNGVLWMIDHGVPLQSGTSTPATLRAYDANDLTHEIYNSTMNAGDAPGYGIKFTSPIAGNGKVYISTGHDPITTTNPNGELDVYGLK